MAVAALAAGLVLLDVSVAGPRVHVRWREGTADAKRLQLESRYGLANGLQTDAGGTWRYQLRETGESNVRALLRDATVADTAYIDRATGSPTEGRSISVRIRYPLGDVVSSPRQLWPLHRSLWLLLGATLLLWVARSAVPATRRNATVAVLLLIGAAALAAPHDPAVVTMGGSADHVRSRTDFEEWFVGRVRFEKHLSQVILWKTYEQAGSTDAAPVRAVVALSRAATVWFVLTALAVGRIERWSPVVVRYLALSLAAPTALLYFGWREFGYLALSAATFPLIVRGLANGSMALEAGSAAAGLGAALHGVGLVSMAGAWLTAIGAAGGLRARAGRALRVVAWGTAAYVGWIAIYVIVLNLSISPDPGPNAVNSWRPWGADDVRLGRVAAAIASPTGLRDILMSAWIVGVPLLPVALSLRRVWSPEVRALLWYLPPSLLFLVFRWPFEGIGGGMDLVVSGFPALYALAWVCAQDERRTRIAAVILATAHYAFWRAVLDERFEP